MGVAINSIKSASVSATIAASLKAVKSAAVFGGMGASIKGVAGDVEITSDLKEVKVIGKKDVKITSETEHVVITGEEDVQLNSNEHHVLIHGTKGSYVGCGTGDAFAIKAEPAELSMGHFSNCEKFKEAKGKDDSPLMKFTKQFAMVSVTGDSFVRVSKGAVVNKTPALTLWSTKEPLLIKGDKILLG
jgi:uncharacterized protein (DUF2345 family)